MTLAGDDPATPEDETGDGSEVARDACADALRWVIPASVAHLFAGLVASTFAALDDYGTPALGYAVGSAAGLSYIVARTDADGIIAAAERSGKLFMVGLVLRFWPEYVELGRRLAAGELGRPRAVSTHRLSPPADWNDWMADRNLSGGVPVDLLVHDFDQMNRLLGTPRSVLAREPLPGHVLASVEYDGAEGVAEGSMQMPHSYPFSSSIRVACERGAADYVFRAAPAEDGGNIGAVDPSARGLRLYLAGAVPETIEFESIDPWGPEIRYFVECIEADRQPDEGTGEQARAALLVALAANRSIESRRPEPV